MAVRDRALSHYRRQKRITLAATVAVRQAARREPQNVRRVTTITTAYQLAAATAASRTMAAEAGRGVATRAAAFAGVSAGGFPIEAALSTVLDGITEELAGGAVLDDLLWQLEQLVAAEVADAGRAAASVEIYNEPTWTNYVRVLNPPSCPRCAVLAGRIYRDNDGFLRHPRCDCVHWPVESWEQAHDEGLVFSAADAFDADQITGLSRADAQAIRDGADISKVVNAHRGMATASIFGHDGIKTTLAGTTKRSAWRKANPNRPYRLRPESIYEIASDRADALRLLRLYGYLTT